mmetsp:Transcript_24970/g.42682  ORF Transcript_24970/g.42682 Transcript_24970/m.42682 type:complete len:302 (-) Transcript_24970:60-965(-)
MLLQRRATFRHVLLRPLPQAVGHGDRGVHLRLHEQEAALLRQAQPRRRQAERHHGGMLQQAHRAVRRQQRQGGAGVRPAPRRRQHDHLLRGEPPLRHDGRRQEDAHLGVWDSRSDQAHCRPDAALDARRDQDAERQVDALPEPGQPDHHILRVRPLQAKPQEALQGPRGRGVRLPAGGLARRQLCHVRRHRRPAVVLGLEVVQGLPQDPVPRPGSHPGAVAPRRGLARGDLLVGRHDQVLGLTDSDRPAWRGGYTGGSSPTSRRLTPHRPHVPFLPPTLTRSTSVLRGNASEAPCARVGIL